MVVSGTILSLGGPEPTNQLLRPTAKAPILSPTQRQRPSTSAVRVKPQRNKRGRKGLVRGAGAPYDGVGAGVGDGLTGVTEIELPSVVTWKYCPTTVTTVAIHAVIPAEGFP